MDKIWFIFPNTFFKIVPCFLHPFTTFTRLSTKPNAAKEMM